MGVARAFKVATPYNGVELSELDYEQTADTMFLAHLDHAPGKLLRTAHTNWDFDDITFGPDQAAPTGVGVVVTNPNQDSANSGDNYFPQPAAYVVTAVNDDTGQESRASSSASGTNDLTLKRNYNTISWTAAASATRYNVYKADNNQFYGYIGTTEDLTFRDDNIGPALDRAPPEADNPFDSTGNYPSTVTLFEQRLIWARTRNTPNGVWGSRIGVNELENMDRSFPSRADDAFSMAIVASQVNPVNQLTSSTSLIALTSHGIFEIDGDGSGGVIQGNQPPSSRRAIGRGASRIRPVVADNVIFFAPRQGYAIRSIGYSFELDGIRSSDVSIFSPHLFEGYDIVDWAYSQEPRSIIWAVRSDGLLLAFTWEEEQQVWGWTRCPTDGLVKSVCTISEDGEDRLYLLVERDVNGTTKRFVERMASHNWATLADSCYMDCAVSSEFSPAQGTFTGLWHLEGRTDLVAIADGRLFDNLTVSGGSLTLPNGATASKISIGIPFQVDIKTLPVRLQEKERGSNLGRRQQVGDVKLHFKDTKQVSMGHDEDHLYPVKAAATTLFSGATDALSVDGSSGQDVEVHVRQTLPGPLTLLGVAVSAVIHG